MVDIKTSGTSHRERFRLFCSFLQQLDVRAIRDVLHCVARIENLLRESLNALIIEALMRGADNHDIGLAEHIVRKLLRAGVHLSLVLVLGNIGIVIGRFRSLLDQVVNDIECRALAIIVDVVLVSDAERAPLRRSSQSCCG